jgi:preprotein translocase subunit YajC
MTFSLATLHLLVAASSSSTKKTSSSGTVTLVILVVVAVAGYFFFLRPQQRKAQAARRNVGSGYEVGDEVQTIGGVVGTILEIHGDRYTLLTGATADDGNLDGAQPTRIVFVRQAIARKLEPVVAADPDPDDEYDEEEYEDEDAEFEGEGEDGAQGEAGHDDTAEAGEGAEEA